MKKTVIIGNWKMNKTYSETLKFISEFASLYNQNKDKVYSNLDFAVALPFTNLSAAQSNTVAELQFSAQDMSQHQKGAYTGEISADMLLDLNVKYVILGHSERRTYHHETDELVNNKAKLAIEKGLVPVICVGETLEEYQAGKTQEVVRTQIENSLKDLDLSKIIVAYEPVWAIGTGKVATPEIAENVCEFIKSITSQDLVLQYGGSVNPKNIEDLHSQPHIDGFLVGGASLEAESFLSLLTLGK
ncbi:triose-phosphate isomerase [Mycoplasmopsis pullorum]|uniref:Triosephosphate isomerase n=1 Tax=Mycoplasmopsis pullorum TaxID=48003 RepID=A0A1L4FS88_9BACT|nr:triose-phosphate isomerase [Mycoplasmopsis pullorum]APJ38468.1 triose-phosphate isomerase [Mycoplasmopsis pullorum]TNK83429.1 triose-phosphate isomerase [Mycoplasmopsis pullorum]TNK92073.1 triose-phosphate isomerase [Mycoplasmopsis pullorum]